MKNFVVILLLTQLSCYGLNVELISWKNCNSARKNVIKLSGKVENGGLVDYRLNITRDVGDFPGVVIITRSSDGDKYTNLTSFNIKACTDLNKVFGDQWANLQKDAAMSNPGNCPMRKGNFFVKNFKFNFNQPKFMGVPSGNIRVTSKFYSMNNKVMIDCNIMTLVKK